MPPSRRGRPCKAANFSSSILSMTKKAFQQHLADHDYSASDLNLLKKQRRRFLNRQYQSKSCLKPSTKSYKKANKSSNKSKAQSTPPRPTIGAHAAVATPAVLFVDMPAWDDDSNYAPSEISVEAADTMDSMMSVEGGHAQECSSSSQKAAPAMGPLVPLTGLDLTSNETDPLHFLTQSAVHSTSYALTSPPPSDYFGTINSSIPLSAVANYSVAADTLELDQLFSHTAGGMQELESVAPSSLPDFLSPPDVQP
eukprot:m.46598 g.46598  ORF g.46598 m.46598 type:complete len:254 (-) comp13158_c0_seq2:568-1329(-)